ncbi:MAG TPA: DUF389 domain-containing protein [Solirubrobacterales bacterium]|nr:DUF389 domain-containing protein [Solirubrobacterales bacterium]
MLRLRSSVAHHRADEFAALLREHKGVHRVVQQKDEALDALAFVFVADVEPNCADVLVERIEGLGIPVDDYVLTRMEVVAPQHRHKHGEGGVDGFAWVEVLGQAQANSRLLARYLALINVAAVIAALGVITSSSILIVGAMAVSPDLLPICATSVGLVSRRYRLARRAFLTLVMGLGLVVVTAMVLSALLSWGGFLPDGFQVDQSSLASLAKTDYSTVLIALAAGVAGMLAFETRASAAVGVAISVTTIPASAYLGVALGAGGIEHALGAAVVLAVNVSLLILSGCLTLLIQQRLPNRSGAPI